MPRLIPLLTIAIALVACQEAPPESLVATDAAAEKKTEAGHAFEADVAMTNFMILPAQALGLPASDFGGRCSDAAAWISVFEVDGQIPHIGDVWGSASHCAYLDDPAMPPTYEDGRGWLRAANGDDIFMEYGNGTAFPVDDGLLAFRDEWTFTGGTGRFANITGSGTDYGEYDPADIMDVDPEDRFPYVMSGSLDYDAADRSPASSFRGTFRIEMSMPYLMAGNVAEDPCIAEAGEGWLTTVMEGRGEATKLGQFTTHAEYCTSLELGQTTARIHDGVTASGATFQLNCDELVMDLPFFVPGLDRVYAARSHELLTGVSGRLEGATADIHSAGHGWITWQPMGESWAPAFPWVIELEMVGTYRR